MEINEVNELFEEIEVIATMLNYIVEITINERDKFKNLNIETDSEVLVIVQYSMIHKTMFVNNLVNWEHTSVKSSIDAKQKIIQML